MGHPRGKYVFGMWDSINQFIEQGQEGLYYDDNGNITNTQRFNGDEYDLQQIRDNPEWYEVDLTQPLEPQLDITRINQFVNPDAIESYRNSRDTIRTTLDFGGITEKDRLIATEDASGMFSFGLAAPTLYRLVEWYIYDTDTLADVDTGIIEKINNDFYYTPYPTQQEPNPKQVRVRRQQKGTYDILKNVPYSKLKKVSDNMYASDPKSGMGRDGIMYKLKFGTRSKKIYLKRPQKGGVPKYIDIFVISGATYQYDSAAMLAKAAPAIMVAEQLEQSGARVRLYGLRCYKISGIDLQDNTSKEFFVFYSWLAKEYGSPIDINAIATLVADPRFFRWAMWQNTEGLARRFNNVNITGYGSTIYEGDDLTDGFALYKNYLMNNRIDGMNRTQVTDKALFLTGGLSADEMSNTWADTEDAIIERYYRLADSAEIALASKPQKSITRIIQRDRERGLTDNQIRERLREIKTDVFKTFTEQQLQGLGNPTFLEYADDEEYANKADKRSMEMDEVITSILR